MGYNVEKRKEHESIRLGERGINNQGCLMIVDKYNGYADIVVRFEDSYNATVHTDYKAFKKGQVKNPYYPSICNVGMIGVKYSKFINGKPTKEYIIWYNMIKRCFDKKEKQKHPTYNNVTCCDEWLLFENFYEWLHLQENFDKWHNGENWCIDKDILIKDNKVYSPKTCCLVPQNVNKLFTRQNSHRGKYPIGICYNNGKFLAQCMNPIIGKLQNIGRYDTIEEAFQAYKAYKEDVIKQIAQIEFNKGNITKGCYESMMNYEVEITD